MKRILIVLTLLSLLPWSGYCQAGTYELQVGTFNVRFLDDNRPDYDYKFGGQPWRVRRPAVKAFVEQNSLDIIGLQEVRRTQAADLEEDFGKDWFIYCPGRRSGGKMVRTSDESTGVMFRRSRFNLLGHGCFWLSETPGDTATVRTGQRSPIITSWVHLEDGNGRRLWFFSAHISWSVKENPALPDQEVETLLSEMERLSGFKRAEFRNSPIFLVGDLNNSPEESAIKTLSGWFNDARLTCPETESTSRKTFNSWGKEKSAGIIDYIFYGTGKPEEYIVDNASYAAEVTYISDHYPVLMRLSMAPEKYILTPKAPAQPRYNGPAVLGARPGHPVYFRLPFSGERPMKYKACGLPKGLTLIAKAES